MQGRDGVTTGMAALVLVWGTAFVAIRELGTVLTPAQITWFRYLPFLVLFGGWLLLRRRKRLAQVTLGQWGRYALIGVLGVFGYHFPLYYGMRDDALGPGATAAMGAVLVATTPLFTLLFSVLMGKERFDRGRALGSMTAFVGVLVVVFLGRGAVEVNLARKAFMVLLAPVFWSLYNILGKPLVDQHGGLFFTGLSMSLGTLLLIPYGIWIGFGPVADFTPSLWGWLTYLSLAATVAGYAIWNYALKRRRPSEVTAWIYLIPVVATTAGWLILREHVTWWLLLGAALVLTGVWRINAARQKETRAATAAAPATTPERP